MKHRILVVDDEQNARSGLKILLTEEGYDVREAADGEEGLALLASFNPDAVLCDIRMPKLDGMQLLERARAGGHTCAFLIVTAFASIESAVQAIKAGADDYVTKPIDLPSVLAKLEKIFEKRALRQENELLRERLHETHRFPNIIGVSSELQSVFDLVVRAAPTRVTVLVLGESGTGKELIAQAIHDASPRKNKPFVKVNCAALSETLLESELFGHEKGSFTGAASRHVGRFELADGGTLFLDEVGDVSPGMQVKLLRVLQQQEFERVGGTQTVKVDVRVVAATNRDLEADVKSGRFREDLYYRINVVSVTVPPLRRRKSDIPALVTHFLDHYGAIHGKPMTGLAPGTLNALLSYDWPGNVRELGNVIERAVVLARGSELTSDDLPATLKGPRTHLRSGDSLIPGATLYEIEQEAVVRTLELVHGSTAKAAEMLGISARKIQYRLQEYAAAQRGVDPKPED